LAPRKVSLRSRLMPQAGIVIPTILFLHSRLGPSLSRQAVFA